MFVMGNLVWDSAGRVSALFGLRGHDGEPAALLPALATLPSPSKLSTVGGMDGHPAGGPRWVLSVEVRGGGVARTACRAAGTAAGLFLRPFGLLGRCPAPRPAARDRAAADRLLAGLAAFQLTETGTAEVRSALGGGGRGWREARCCGYAASASGGRPSYRACFVALPLGGTRAGIEWPLEVSRLPAAAWGICVQPVRGGAEAALLAGIVAGDLVDLGERAAALRRAVRERGWDLIRPSSGQGLLGAALAPGAAHRRLPRSLFFPFPQASADLAPGLSPVS